MIIYIGKNIPPHVLVELVNKVMLTTLDTIELKSMDDLKLNVLPTKPHAEQVSDCATQNQTISLTPTKP